MEKFIVYEQKNNIRYQLEYTKDITVRFELLLRKGNWEWNYIAWNPSMFTVIMEKERFFPSVNTLKQKELTEINLAFYELLRQIKYEPSQRLKVLNKLDESVRDIWNAL
jgi:hypothetical protein